ncbi:MAG: HAD hydrolase-like protein [Clostridia bacterium]|nr:HAD hydrolase-like protein [Clostridia bacterium]
MKYKIALFDLDGTLVDSSLGVTNSVKYALEKMGEKIPENLLRFIGPPLTVSFREFCGFDEEKTDLAIKLYREYYSQKGIYECVAYEGMTELLKELKDLGITTCLATSKPDIYATRVVEDKCFLPYLDFLSCASADEKTLSTKEQVIERALSFVGENKSEIVMIGDRHFDINGAKCFGLDSIGVTFGFGSEKELTEAGASYIAHNPQDIKRIIMQ